MERELILFWAAVVAYVLSGVTAICGVVWRRRPDRWVLGLLLLALGLHATAMGWRWERLGHGPYITLFEILSSHIWSVALVFAVAYWRLPVVRPMAAAVMPVLFLLLGWMMLSDPEKGALPATYHTVWLFIHIAFSKLFAGSVLVALGIAALVLARLGAWGRGRLAQLPADERLDDLAYRWLALALIFDSLMLISGAIWAQDAWGRYWAWDPLETWAFITWLLLALALHVRFTFKTSPRLGALMIVAVFLAGFLTFFGVPFITDVPHQGAV